jgi:putative membrane-bound dehydrogenase-like protein
MTRMNSGSLVGWCVVLWAAATISGPSSGQAVAQSTGAAAVREDRPALSAAESLSSFVVEPGYRIDLVAAEPLVQSPVAIAFDEGGRMYVAENRGYPDPLEGQPAAKPQGVIARLTDTDGDGRYDARTDFATGLTYPNGVMVWDGGVFVTAAPDLLYLKDSDGDGIADERRVVLTGFNANRTAQIRFSHPTLGPDGWIYMTAGLNGGRVRSPAHPDRPAVEFTSSDSRFNPRTEAFELTGGQGQFGLTFDDYGRRFICANRNPVWHVVLEPGQLNRNRNLAFSQTVQEVSATGAQARVWPISRDLTTASFTATLMNTPHVGTFTSASGVYINRGDALPDGQRGSVFIAESAQNLVQRQVLEHDGVSFRSRPAREGVEFLASRDTWFRPVFLTNGPDGALYIVDMYRKDIDHPAYVPEASRPLFDFSAGNRHGRIYRMAAADRRPARSALSLTGASIATLVSNLEHSNGWRRDTAQRLLIERGARAAAAPLRRLAGTGGESGRLHALWTLDALGLETDEDILQALRNSSPGVRENALRLAERRLPSSPRLFDAVSALAGDPDAKVRLHVALTLGAVDDPRRIAVLAAIARRDGADRWVRAAVLSSVGDRASAFLDAFASGPAAPAARAAVMQDLGGLFGASEPLERCLALVREIADPAADLSWQPAALAGVAAGLRTRSATSNEQSPLMALVAAATPQAREAHGRLVRLMERAGVFALRDDVAAEERLAAIDLLAQSTWSASGSTLLRLLEPQREAAIQIAAVRALGQLREPAAAASLLEPSRWQAYTPQVRDAVLSTFLSDERLVPVLLDAVSRRDIAVAALGASRWRRLTAHRNSDIRQRAAALYSADDTGAGRQAYERKLPDVLAHTGDPGRGATAFTKYCAACHSFNERGGGVGPDLSGIRNQPSDALLLHIVLPDYEITPGYEAYTVRVRDGRTLIGRLESEAPNSLTLRDGTGQSQTIVRTEITSMTAAASSLMPAGFGEALSAGELADVIAYLKSAPR